MRSVVFALVLLLEAFSCLKLTEFVAAEEDHDDIITMLQETGKRIDEWSSEKNKECTTETDNKPSRTRVIERIENLPSDDMVGVDHDMLHLCATVSGGVYDAASRTDFEELLRTSEIRKRFPDLTLRFFQNGVTFGRGIPEALSFNAPTFVGLITGSTLILGWRGTVTIKDALADCKIDSIAPWKGLKGLEVQKAYYEMMKREYLNKYHGKDIENYVKGNYSKIPNLTKKDGTPITKIILTGHSLGGALAQVAHVCMRAPPNNFWSPWPSLVKACKDVEIRTIAISAPMTFVVEHPAPETTKFLQDVIEPCMRNVFFNADVVPRGYSNLEFIDGFVNAFLEDHSTKSSSLADQLATAFVNLHVKIFKLRGMMEQAIRYRHVGKLIYYDNPKAVPVMYVDPGFYHHKDATETGDEPCFRDLRYGPQSKVADMALENHMVLVNRSGLVYQT